MLQVLVSRHPMVFTRSQLATLAYLSPRSGTFGTYLSALRSGGFIQEEHDHFQAMQAGMEYRGTAPAPPQTPEENIAMWREKLNGGARRMFDVLVSAYPEALTREEVAEQAGLMPTTGTFGTYLSQLRSNELIEVRDGRIKASENLFV